jgi:gamma-glutamyl-gamma-aminobutyrate hydrolase PuuD
VGLNASRRPVVGLTTYLEQVQSDGWDVPAGYLSSNYFEGVIAAGGIAVLLPPQPVDPEIAGSVLDSLDGLVLTGGYDLDPATYGQEPHPRTDQPRTVRDAFEFALLRGALDRGLPVLGICRGIQVLKVGDGLMVSAWDPEGMVEGLEVPGDNFVVAVQWHPEQSLDDLRLFRAIVDAARTYAGSR